MNDRKRLEAIIAVVKRLLEPIPPDGKLTEHEAMNEIIGLVDPLPPVAEVTDETLAAQATEIQRLRDELELCSQLKREYQERAAKSACGEVVVDIVKGVGMGLLGAFDQLAAEEHELRTRLGWKRFFSIDWWAVHSFRRD